MKDIAIYGAGGLARQTLSVIDAVNVQQPSWRFRGYVVDAEYKEHAGYMDGCPIVTNVNQLFPDGRPNVLVAVGEVGARQRISRKLRKQGCKFPILIHPGAWIGRNISFGEGSVVSAGCSLSTDVRIGDHVYLNAGCIVNHDVELGAFCITGPGVVIAGHVKIDDSATIGAGATFIPRVLVGKKVTIGAGSLVTKSIPNNSTAVGAPARIKKKSA